MAVCLTTYADITRENRRFNDIRLDMRIAAIQMTSTDNKTQNLREAKKYFDQALKLEPDLICFPESFNFLSGRSKDLLKNAETLTGVTVETLQEWAAENDVWIHGGSIFLKAGTKRITNTSLLISDHGEIAARYDKIHLFDAKLTGDKTSYEESKIVKPGKRIVIADTPFGYLGLSICYDLRFPELYRNHSLAGANVIFVPAAFTELSGRAHWDILTRARAIENQAFVIAAAQTGSPYGNRKTYGHSRIIDPWGRVLAERPAEAGVVWADLDFSYLYKVRTELPALKHRKI